VEVEVVDEWFEWPGYVARDQEGAEQLLSRLAEVLGYTIRSE
jgi:hypothetical protein